MRRSSSTLRIAALGGLCLAAGACAPTNESVSLEQSVPSAKQRMLALAPAGTQVATDRPLVSIPGEQVASVRAKNFVNGLRQDVLFKGGAMRGVQNGVTVLVRTSRQQTLDEQVPLERPSEASIRSEIGGAFPHIAMQVVERASNNAYGPYGLALGRAGGDVRCAYMWQWIDENRLPVDAGFAGPVSIRVRLCQAGTTFDAMASQMDRLVVGAAVPFERTAVVAPVEAPPAPVTTAKKRKVAHRPKAAHRAAPVAAEVPSTEVASGPRYMGAAPLPAPSAPVQLTTPAVPKLSGDLPAQAYLGPSAPATKAAATKYY